jgi:hypothetical protein
VPYGLEGSSTLVAAISAGAARLARGNVGVVRLLRHCGDVRGVIDGGIECWLGCRGQSESAGSKYQGRVGARCGCARMRLLRE